MIKYVFCWLGSFTCFPIVFHFIDQLSYGIDGKYPFKQADVVAISFR